MVSGVELGQGVLEDGVGERPAGHHLAGEQRRPQRLAVGRRHGGRQRQVADALAGRQQRLAVGVDDDGVGVVQGRRLEPVAVEHDAVVRLVRQQVDRAADLLLVRRQQPGQGAQRLRRVDAPAGVVGRVDDDGPGPRRQRPRRWPRRSRSQLSAVDLHAHRDRAPVQRQRLVEEPGRRVEDDLVAGIDDGVQRGRQPAERAVGHADVVVLVRQAVARAQRARPPAPAIRARCSCRRTSPCSGAWPRASALRSARPPADRGDCRRQSRRCRGGGRAAGTGHPNRTAPAARWPGAGPRFS